MFTLWIFIDQLHWSAILSLMVNQLIVLTYVFYLNKLWAFKSTGQTKKEVQRYLIMYFFNYIFAIAWMWLWHNKMGFEPKLVRLINIILAVSWNFLLYKFFVYHHKGEDVNKSTIEAVI
jgi:putative flippase GtrA